MGLELIVFITAVLFGILLYWRESNGNRLYRFVNKIVNSKELQMKASDKKGFVYKQEFLPRLVYVVALILLIAIIIQFLTPFKIFGSVDGISMFASSIVGTLIGTYVANFVIKSGNVIEEKSGSLETMVSDAVEKGKDFIDDIKNKGNATEEEVEEDVEEVKEEDVEKDTRSARERLKDKGYL